jgi:hypothetical protein
MNDIPEVISAFLDDEPFEPSELARALSEPDGRAALIDLLALRHVMQPGKDAAFVDHRSQGSRWRAALAVAAVLVAMVGGYLVGERQTERGDAAPAATRIIEAPAAWQPLP